MKAKKQADVLYAAILFLLLGSIFALLMAGTMLVFRVGVYTAANVLDDIFLGGRSEALFYSESPNGTHLLLVERVEDIDGQWQRLFVSRLTDDSQYPLYYGPDAEQADIRWLSEHVVCINGVSLDLIRYDSYDFREQSPAP